MHWRWVACAALALANAAGSARGAMDEEWLESVQSISIRDVMMGDTRTTASFLTHRSDIAGPLQGVRLARCGSDRVYIGYARRGGASKREGACNDDGKAIRFSYETQVSREGPVFELTGRGTRIENGIVAAEMQEHAVVAIDKGACTVRSYRYVENYRFGDGPFSRLESASMPNSRCDIVFLRRAD